MLNMPKSASAYSSSPVWAEKKLLGNNNSESVKLSNVNRLIVTTRSLFFNDQRLLWFASPWSWWTCPGHSP